jgi:hypothetical protein
MKDLTPFHIAILERRKYLSSVAGKPFSSVFSVAFRKPASGYLMFIKDFFSKIEYEQNQIIAGFSSMSQSEKLKEVGYAWKALEAESVEVEFQLK